MREAQRYKYVPTKQDISEKLDEYIAKHPELYNQMVDDDVQKTLSDCFGIPFNECNRNEKSVILTKKIAILKEQIRLRRLGVRLNDKGRPYYINSSPQ